MGPDSQGNTFVASKFAVVKPIFHLANLFARTNKKVGTVPTCSRQIFPPVSFNQSRLSDSCFRFASREQSRQVENRFKFSMFPRCCFKEIVSSLEMKISNNPSSFARSEFTVYAFVRKTIIELAVYS